LCLGLGLEVYCLGLGLGLGIYCLGHNTGKVRLHGETERQKVLYSKHFVTSQKCPYHVTFDLDLDLKHNLDAGSSVDHRVPVWWRSSHFVVEVAICAKFTDS